MKITKLNSRGHSALPFIIIFLVILLWVYVGVRVVSNDSKQNTSSATNNAGNLSISNYQATLLQTNINEQNTCTSNAYTNYTNSWKAADKDGDGKLNYVDGSHTININYYDSMINCYISYKTDDSSTRITDYQSKRQQEVDQYNTWLNAVSNAAKSYNYQPTYQRTPVSCWTNTIGSSTYTNCY